VVLLIVICIVFGVCIIREKRKRKVYIQNNGGTILQNLANIKLYNKKDIKKIQTTRNLIGHGGFGNVYKGCIGNDPQLVAVKVPINQKSKLIDTFTNEIIIQSRVSHKNIVRLLGCCIEVEVPILVYEFVPKGNLDVILHGDKSIPLSLGQRLQIAAESAEGLAFMHSKTTAKILHGDVKPANILINNDYAPKISDFGISRLIATDMEHTRTVIGDVNYMDPVFVQTGMLTNKSDVYSFGVVLLELITRKKASRSNQNGLLSNFSEAYKKDKSMIELVDKELVEVDPQLLYILAGIINECLSLDVNERPYMTDIEERLRDIVKRFRSTE
jgi:serine/threonine protein kinase